MDHHNTIFNNYVGIKEEMIQLEERYLSKDYSPFDKNQGAARVRDEMAPIAELAVPPKMRQRRTKGNCSTSIHVYHLLTLYQNSSWCTQELQRVQNVD